MIARHWLHAVAVAGLMAAAVGHADPLERPARRSELAGQRLLLAAAPVAEQGRVVVGQRGHVLRSTDRGTRWQQADVPVSTDLTAVQFVSDVRGYAVGHDGVVLRTDDGGQRWRVMLDGRQANALAKAQLNPNLPPAVHEQLSAELQRNLDAGPNKPWLDVHFTGPDTGFVVGAYNLILETRDGGNTWTSWYDRTDNRTDLLNLHAIRPHRGSLYIAGEAGLLMRLDATRERFVRVDTGYSGSYFGLVDTGDGLLVHGMRGNARWSPDEGRTWLPVATGLVASITAATRAPDGRVWLADQMGRIAVGTPASGAFKDTGIQAGMAVTALHVDAERVLATGSRGVRTWPLPKD